jgi:hypothetical protein
MAPRVQLRSVPFAVQALTVPDGSVTTAKIADEAVTQVKLGADVSLIPPAGSITTTMIADSAVNGSKVMTGSLRLSHTNFLAGVIWTAGPYTGCDTIGGENHCYRVMTVTHNYGSANYYVVTGFHHGYGAHRYSVTISGQTANSFDVFVTSILGNGYWSETDNVGVNWLLLPRE